MNAFEKILLGLFLISSMLFFGFIIGPFSLRIYLALIMVFYLILKYRRFAIFDNFELRLYFLFILFFLFNLIFTNQFYSFNFGKYFLSRFLICFIMVGALGLIKSKKDLQFVINLLIVIGILNVIVNILQFFDIGSQFYAIFKNTTDPDSFLDEDALGLSVGTYGLFGNIVTNGYYSSVFAILFLHKVNISKTYFRKVFYILLFSLGVFAVFATQQRSSLLMLLFFIFLAYSYKVKNAKKIFFGLLITLTIILSYPYLQDIEIGRYQKLTDENRSALYAYAIDFISNHIWFGGINEYRAFMQSKIGIMLAPHNVFLNAFIYSGLLGGVTVIILFFRMLTYAFKIFVNSIGNMNAFSVTFFGCFLVFMGNSLTHNLSLVTGNEFIWFFFILTIKSNNINSYKNVQRNDCTIQKKFSKV